MVKGLQTGWGACLRTVWFDSFPQVLACWNNLIAVGLDVGKIVLLDATTGVCTSTLSGHTDHVTSLVFSSDGTSLVSGSDDKTVRLWDIQTGGVARIFHGHGGPVRSVSISPGQTTIASGSEDKTVRLWNAQTGECCCVIGHNNIINTVNFSPTDSQLLISGSSDNTVQQWDIGGHQIGPAYGGSHAVFSPNGTHFIVWEEKGVATIQNSDSGVIVTKLRTPSNSIRNCCFSPDGKLVAGIDGGQWATVYHGNIYIWDISSSDPHPIKTWAGDTWSITSTAFSSSIIVSCQNNTIKLWQIDTLPTNPVVGSSESKPLTSTPIMSVSVQAKDHIATSSDEAGFVGAWDILTGICKASIKTSARSHSHRDIQLIDGGLLIVWYTRKRKIHIWDTKKAKRPQVVDARSDFSTTSLRISGDGSKIFLLDKGCIQALSTQTGEVVGRVRLEGEPSDNPLIVDGLRVWVYFKSSKTQGWDFGIPGPTPATLSNELLPSPRLELIHSTTPNPLRVNDTVAGKELFHLPKRYEEPAKIHCDGQYLVAGYKSGELLLLDFGKMIPK